MFIRASCNQCFYCCDCDYRVYQAIFSPKHMKKCFHENETFSSKVPNIKGLPFLCNKISEDCFFFLSNFWYLILKFLAVLSPNLK